MWAIPTANLFPSGERIGYLVIPDEADGSEELISAATIANRTLGCVNAPSLIQKVVAKCVDAKTDLAAYDKNRQALYNGLKECGFECIKPQGAFYLFVKSPVEDEKPSVKPVRNITSLWYREAPSHAPVM